ncbi:PAS domain-containing protein [Mariniflexile ostreae]|uniref:PAS domain-containing protein n=1 Tax=Mariniflexile ostreae TaxID=1520892 RepID=A0ABV5FBV7_9FLAO
MKKNLSNMMCLDLYLSSLNTEEYKAIKHDIIHEDTKIMPLLCWDVFSQNYFKTLKQLKRKQDIVKVKALAKKLNWSNNMDTIFEDKAFEAIIITDLNQSILWTNDGFTEMTGYSKSYALHKKPNFLQGEKSSADAKQKIRNGLKDIKPFTAIITNYKKNKTSYQCEVTIFPLFNTKTTHFIALERQVV